MATETNEKHTNDNELAHVLEKSLPFFEKYGNTLLLAVAAILAVAALFIYMGKMGGEEELGWSEMSAARETGDYASIAERFPGTNVGNWAQLIEADSYLQSAVQLSFSDREASRRELKTANEKYDALLAMDVPANVKERVLFGLAKCAETGCDGDTSAATAAYNTLLSEFPESVYKELAEQRIADLGSESTQEFYAFFAKQEPKPGDRIAPRDGAMPIQADLPETPLLLQKSGFNNEAEPPVPQFTPEDDAAKPVDPQMAPNETGTEATQPATDATETPTTATPGTEAPVDQTSAPVGGTEGTPVVTEPAVEPGTVTTPATELPAETTGGTPVETPGGSKPPATEGSNESK